jgi:hypothetical protein
LITYFKSWIQETCEKNGWKKHTKSPLIWRELVTRGGKGMYLGDGNDFQEYARDYYGITSELDSNDLRKISSENEKTYEIVAEEKRQIKESIKPFVLTITNPESPVLYYIINDIVNGKTFGSENEISLRLYTNNKNNLSSIQGIRMEIEDLSSDKLRFINVYQDSKSAFENTDFAIVLDELNASDKQNPYTQLSLDIDEYAKKTCKILITPYESHKEIYSIVNHFAKQLKNINAKTNLIGNSLCDEMQAKAILAQRLHVSPAYVKNVFVIGQSLHDSFYVDLMLGQVTDYDGAVWARTNTHWLNLVSMLADKDWIRKEYLNLVHQRGMNQKIFICSRTALRYEQIY